MRIKNLQVCKFANLLICIFASFVGCTQTPTPTVERVRLSLVADTSTAPLIDELVAVYQSGQPHVVIDVEHAANARRALAALRAGQCDLAVVSWLPDENKLDEGLWFHAFARDAIVMVTHLTNPVGGVSLSQLRDIYSGQSIFWTDLGGSGLDVVPVSREDGAGTRASFEALVMGNRTVAPTSVVMPSNEAVVEFVSATPGAVGYVSTAWLNPAVNILAVEGVTPSPAAVGAGRYLLSRPFFLVARTQPVGPLGVFVEWVSRGAGQELVTQRHAPAP